LIIANIDDPNLDNLLPGEIWAEAINWIRENAATAEQGIHPLRGDAMFINVMTYSSEPRELCRFESHRTYIDLQYTIEGIEGIDYRNRSDLEDDGAYDKEKDVQFHLPMEASCTLPISGNTFCVFFPEDAHRPKLALKQPAMLKKLVVKIDLKLLNNEQSKRIS
jgi:YhcH/YjgK/YiaL family protein